MIINDEKHKKAQRWYASKVLNKWRKHDEEHKKIHMNEICVQMNADDDEKMKYVYANDDKKMILKNQRIKINCTKLKFWYANMNKDKQK